MKKGIWKLIIGAIFLIAGIFQGSSGFAGGLIIAVLCFFWWYFPARKSMKQNQTTKKDVSTPTAPQQIVRESRQYIYITERHDDERIEPECNLFFYRDKLNSKKGLSSFDTYVVLDCETTGLSATNDEIIEIAMAKFIKGQEVDRLHSLVRPTCQLPRRITQLTGITNDDLKDAPLIEDIAPKMWDFIQGYYLVGYNIPFDIGFIKKAFAQLDYEGVFNYVDVLQLARKAYPDMPNHKLATLIQAFNLADGQTHRAFDDVICTQKLLVLCLDVLLTQKEKELAARREAKRG